STIENIEVLQDFADGATFLEYLKEHEHRDIVLLDLVMPGMNGIEITEYIKAHSPDIKVLVLTSYVDDEHVISAINKGADGYEMKAVEPQQLIENIRRVMNGEPMIHPKAPAVFEPVSQTPHYKNKLSKREIEELRELV
ncbi:response regulator, partial [Staphylococcus aureus]|uniref:response regulator n=1 Tax=Staphylococcus aureus TaxID=1280 RepID=UPI002109839E